MATSAKLAVARVNGKVRIIAHDAGKRVILGEDGLTDKGTLEFIATAKKNGLKPWNPPAGRVSFDTSKVIVGVKEYKTKDRETGAWVGSGRFSYYLAHPKKVVPGSTRSTVEILS